MPSEAYTKELEAAIVGNGGDCIPFYRATCPLSLFLDPAFMDVFIRQNSCLVVSETRLDHDDSFAIANGKLYFSLTKETFERAGLTAQVTKPSTKSANRKYRISYDLRSPNSLKGASAQFDRLLWVLDNMLTNSIPFAFTMFDSKGAPLQLDTFPEAKALFTSYQLASSFVKCKTTVYEDISAAIPEFVVPDDPQSTTVTIPESEYNSFLREVHQEWALNLQEWLGMVSLGSDRLQAGDSIDPCLCDYEPAFVDSSLKNRETSITVLTWSGGLIPSSHSWRAWQAIATSSSWASLSVHGVEDAPVSWGSREHMYASGGENHYTAIKLAPSAYDYLLLELTGGGDN